MPDSIAALWWLGRVLYAISPGGFVNYHTVFLVALMLDQVLFNRLSQSSPTRASRARSTACS